MNKACEPSPPMRKRRMVARPPASKTSQLEKKIDGLVTLVKSATQAAPGIINTLSVNNSPEPSVPPSYETVSSSTAARTASYREYAHDKLNTGFGNSNLTSLASSTSPSSSRSFRYVFDPVVEPGPEEAEAYLNIFREDFIKNLPCIVIPPSMTAHQLRQERPILWMSIMTAASNNTTQQILFSKQILETFGKEAYVEGTRNMDFLLAVLVYSAW